MLGFTADWATISQVFNIKGNTLIAEWYMLNSSCISTMHMHDRTTNRAFTFIWRLLNRSSEDVVNVFNVPMLFTMSIVSFITINGIIIKAFITWDEAFC